MTTELEDLKARVRILEVQVAENTELTVESIGISKSVKEDTADLVAFTKNAQGALNTANWIAKMLKPIGYLGFIIASIWGLLTIGKAMVVAAVQSGQIK